MALRSYSVKRRLLISAEVDMREPDEVFFNLNLVYIRGIMNRCRYTGRQMPKKKKSLCTGEAARIEVNV